MKKIITTIILALCFFTSCRESQKENINIYVDKNLDILVKEIVETYEDQNENIKINILSEIPRNFNNLDMVITADENVFIPMLWLDETNETDEVKESAKTEIINFRYDFDESFFADDYIVLVGRRKLNDLNDLLYSHIASPNYDNIVGKLFIDSVSNLELFKEISKKIEYTEDSISAMQSVDLYEVDYAVVNTLLLKNIKNSKICYTLSKTDKEGNKLNEIIIYNKYIKKESSENVKKFYEFLENRKVQKIIDEHKKV